MLFESSFHGYDTIDYKKVDCRLGDNESFKKICKTLHENGIKIILDGVFNHVGRDFFAFKDVQQNLQNSQYFGVQVQKEIRSHMRVGQVTTTLLNSICRIRM